MRASLLQDRRMVLKVLTASRPTVVPTYALGGCVSDKIALVNVPGTLSIKCVPQLVKGRKGRFKSTQRGPQGEGVPLLPRPWPQACACPFRLVPQLQRQARPSSSSATRSAISRRAQASSSNSPPASVRPRARRYHPHQSWANGREAKAVTGVVTRFCGEQQCGK